MSLSNMQVFINNARELTVEKVGQAIDKFNSASFGTVRLSANGFSGDFFEKSFYNTLISAQRRVDRYATNSAVSATALSQSKMADVKVAGGFGPILFEPSQMTWIQTNEMEALDVISNAMTEAIIYDQLNTGVKCLVGAISNQAGATNDVSATLGISQTALNNTDALFGDASSNLVARIMRGSTYHKLIGQAITNANTLFNSGTVKIVDILGKPIIITDAGDLREAGTPNKEKILTLATGAITIGDVTNLVTNVQTTNGKERIETTYQADYDYTLSMLGYSWDMSNGGKSPTNAELGTGTNWDLVVNSIKHSAGVITIGDESK